MKMLSNLEIDAVAGATLAADAGVVVGGAIAKAVDSVQEAVGLMFSKVYAGAVV